MGKPGAWLVGEKSCWARRAICIHLTGINGHELWKIGSTEAKSEGSVIDPTGLGTYHFLNLHKVCMGSNGVLKHIIISYHIISCIKYFRHLQRHPQATKKKLGRECCIPLEKNVQG